MFIESLLIRVQYYVRIPSKWLIADIVSQKHDFRLKMHHKAFAVGLPEPAGELTALHRPPS